METFVCWLCITDFILNNAHCTQRLLCSAATEQRLELQQGSYIGSLGGIEAIGLAWLEKGLCEVDKASGTFDLHGFCSLTSTACYF